MNRFAGITHALLRIVSGLLFIFPGGMKLLHWYGGMPVPMTPLLMVAGWLELVGGPLIMLGLLTRPVAFILSGEMAFAYFMGHMFKTPDAPVFIPLLNGGNAAILFCFACLYLACAGGGVWSADAMMKKK